jgi:choline transport protein
MLIFGTIGAMATASRMLWAFAREEGVPGSHYIAKVYYTYILSSISFDFSFCVLTYSKIEPSTGLPLYSIATTAIISMLYALIGLGSNAAFNALTGLTVASFYTGFIVCALLMLYRHFTVPNMPWGPFRLGVLRLPVAILSLVYSIVGIIFCFWPPVSVVTVEVFNWSLIVFFGVVSISILWWALVARNTYQGPKMEISSQRWMELFAEPIVTAQQDSKIV